MLHIALNELPRCRPQHVLARDIGAGDAQCHYILQLIAKAIGAAGLVVRRSRPDPTAQRLIQQPIVK